MAGKVFISYRREDDPSAAARVRDALAARFGKTSLFMDVDSLAAGQRFDQELAKALTACDVFIAIIGPRWMDLLKSKSQMSGLRDYVREEIALALRRKIVVVPVRVGSEGRLPSLPQAKDLPSDVRDLVLYQKHDVAHERFARDVAELADVIERVHRSRRPNRAFPWVWTSAAAAGVIALSLFSYHFLPALWLRSAGIQSTEKTAAIHPPQEPDLERAAAFINQTEDQERLEAFIRQFGDTPYADIARARLERLKRQALSTRPAQSTGPGTSVPDPGVATNNRGWLGVKIQNIDADTAASLGLGEPKGALVTDVTTSGPAAEAGLKNGDAILSVNGSAVADSRDLARQIAGFSPNSKVDVRILRDQKEQTIAVKLGKFPPGKELARVESNASAPLQPQGTEMDQLGLTVAPGTGANKDGVVVTDVNNGSDAAQKGIKTGDVILEVGGLAVRNPEDLANGIKEATKLGRKAVLVRVKSGDQTRFVAVQLRKS